AIFISHAVTDAPITKSFVNLIESGIGVSPKNIFCTSNKGQGIRPGAEFKESIRENLDEATTVIALISENYYNSPFCMCELGGTWLQAKDFIPILIPPIRFSDMKAVLIGLQAIRIQVSEDLDELRDEIAERLYIKPLPTPRWNEKRDEFLKDLDKKLKKSPPSPVVQRELLDKAENVIKEYEEALSLTQDENTKLKNTVSKLKKAKNAKEVSKIVREDMEEADVFDELIKDLKKKLNELESVTVEVFFVGQRGEDYYPGRESAYFSWDDTMRAQEYKEVELNNEENGIQINNNHPKVRKALYSIYELENWLNQASSGFIEWYMEEHDDYEPDLSDRTFWDNHLW
ncbi:hypothetical protein C6A37_04025, partial [Desulfobacteraceae bacterium SEEP-SAG9]